MQREWNSGKTAGAVRRKIGRIEQLGGTRHYELTDGKSRGMRVVDVDTGAGLRFSVVPDRSMDISLVSYKGTNLTYLTPSGEVHPAYYSEYGMEWLRTFFGGLLTTCGLTYIGPPGKDGKDDLGLHGRQSAIPARRFCDGSGFRSDDYLIELSGTMEDSVLFGDKIELRRTIATRLGSKSLTITDDIENLRSEESPFVILYHINFGYPLLDSLSEIYVSSKTVEAYDEASGPGLDRWNRFNEPKAGRGEEDYFHTMTGDSKGFCYAALVNRRLGSGLGVYIRFNPDQLPYLTEWKMAGEIDYVLGLEPSNTKCMNRADMRKKGLLPILQPREHKQHEIEIGILEGEDEIDTFIESIGDITPNELMK